MDEQKEAYERQLEDATGYRSLADFMEAKRKIIDELGQRFEASSGEANKYRTLYEKNVIKAEILAAAGEAINPEMVFSLFGAQAVVSEDGSVSVAGKPAKDAVTELLEQYPYLAKPRGSPGSGTPMNVSIGLSGMGIIKNPWSKENFNLTEQARILRENPSHAQQLKAAAGA